MKQKQGQFTASADSVAVSDATQFIQLIGAAGVCIEILELRVFQTADTAIALNGIVIERGVGGAGGTAATVSKWVAGGAAAVGTVNHAAPSSEVGTLDFTYRVGWNILQEAIWLPTPEMQLWLRPSDDLGVRLTGTDILTIGYSLTWNEYDAG
jgi:hypothetical protein